MPLTMQFPLLGLTRDFHPLDNAHAEHTKALAACFQTARALIYINLFRSINS